MLRDELSAYIADQYGVEPDYPWMDNNCVFRHRENNKWFAVILEVPSDKLGLPSKEALDVLNLKCDPLLAGAMRTQPGFHPAYHMNKEKWISIRLDGTVPLEQIVNYLAISYDLTGLKKKKK